MRHPLWQAVAACWVVVLSTQAQEPRYQRELDKDISAFQEQQQAMEELMARQLPLLRQAVADLQMLNEQVTSLATRLSYRQRVPAIRDSALYVLNRLRRQNQTISRQAGLMYQDWFQYHRLVEAVFTRYGELLAIDNVDSNLRGFIERYREVFALLELVFSRSQAIYQESEFLLNAKLY